MSARSLPLLRARRTRSAAQPSPSPPEPCPLPLLACASGRPVSDPGQTWARPDRRVGAQLGRRGLRRRDRGGARGDRARRRLPGEPRPASRRRRSKAIPRRSPRRSRRCGRSSPRPFVGDGWAIVSASPELFLARRGRPLVTKPIKGTRPAGEDVDGAKDDAEHVMIVDLERNDLARVCEPGIDPLARADARSTSSRASRISSRPSRGTLREDVDARGDPRARRFPAARSPARRRSPRST